MRSQDLKRAKRAVRAEVLGARDAVPPAERSERGATIARRFLDLPEVRDARAVFLFWSFGSEVPTEPVWEALVERGVTVALPRIRGSELEARSFRPGDPLAPTAFGAMEPEGGSILAPEELDVVTTPGVAFDTSGRRVGYGGGFYDRFLPRTRPDAPSIAIAFDLQVVAGPLPAGGFDRRVAVIVTESRTIRPST
ncbi:MAG TPA: 5-formyltetrahydrofolate cyclo-ligase [Actinomycetota bacterium]|jgi:5-formyltetrahydrofolate cyclo-ligase